MWNLDYDYKRTYLQNRNRFTNIENKLGAAKGKGVGKGWAGRMGLVDASYFIENG